MSPIFKPVFFAALMVILAACSDLYETDGEEPTVTIPPFTLRLAPGTIARVNLYGCPPFSITTPPDATIASASIIDSNLIVSCHDSARVGDQTFLAVDDSCGNTFRVSIYVADISYSDDIQPIWDGQCQNRGCHPGAGAPFSLDRFVSWSNLWFAPVTNQSCGAVYRIVGGLNGGPGKPDSSLLYLLVTGQTSCQRMPFSMDAGDTLSGTDQDKIKTWILAGAPNN